MVGTFAAMAEALATIFSWPTIAFVVIGTLIGMIFGALPGLGGTIALALLIPLTFGMDATPAMVLFGATLGGVAFGGSISAILINVPGTGPNAATLLDGYPMARQGRAGEALGVSATASALGAIFGLVVLVLVLPVAREVILAFSSPEFFWLAVFGLTIIAVTSRGQMLKGIISGGIGLLLAFIGYNAVTGVYRYGFGTEYLWDGVQLVPALIGLFALAEVIKLAAEGGTIAEGGEIQSTKGALKGVKIVLSHPITFLRSAATGTIIGMVPGAGGTVANFISYMGALQSDEDPESYGKGNPKGVIASEAANDAKDGGALLPAIVFGIPGSAAIAVMLGGFILHGLNPGRQLLNEGLPILFTLIFALLFANILTSVIGLSIADQIAKLTRIPVDVLTPAILVVSLVGAFAIRNSLGDVVIAVVFGFIGYAMIAFDYSRIAVVIALILGELAERSFLQSLMISDNGAWIFVTRPISLILIVLTLVGLALPFVRGREEQRDVATDGGERL
jgi:putative tricarboxylic transport membrane protein